MRFGATPSSWRSIKPKPNRSRFSTQRTLAGLHDFSDSPLHSIGQDFRYAARGLTSAPALTAAIVFSLSIGLAVIAGAFAFLTAALFPSIPGVTGQQRLVRIDFERRCGSLGCGFGPSTFDEYRVVRDALPTLNGLSASAPMSFAVGARGQVMSVRGALVSANMALAGAAIGGAISAVLSAVLRASICDLIMPKIDGWSFRRLQQQSAALSSIPFVVISASLAVDEEASSLAADMVLRKPVDLDDIVRCAKMI